MRTTSTPFWVAGGAGAAVLIAAGGFLLGVQPQLAHAGAADTTASSTEAQVAATQAKVAALAKAAARQGELETEAETLYKSVPTALQQNTFYRRLNTVAALDEVEVQSVVLSGDAATAYTAPTTSAAGTVAEAPASTPAPTASATVAPAAPTPTAPVLAATDPLITAANFTVVPTTVVVKGTSDAGLQFIKDMQRDERLLLVSKLTTAADPDDPAAVITTISGSIYTLQS